MIRGAGIAAALCLFAFSPAHAQATRTWVSGVGDDANPCSRTAPCKTFAGAISKTAAGGEISVLDPGGFGTVTITKSITIDGNGVVASILNAGVSGVTVNADANAVVILRNIEINGSAGVSPGSNGIKFIAGKELHLDNVKIQNNLAATPNGNGVAFLPSAASKLFVTNCVFNSNGSWAAGALSSGILVRPVLPGGSAQVTVEGTTFAGNLQGMRVETGGVVIVKNSSSTGNLLHGFWAISGVAPGAIISLDNVSVAHNTSSGVRAEGANTLIRMSNTSVFNNLVGLARPGAGQIISYQNNRISDNGTNGTPSSTVAQQ